MPVSFASARPRVALGALMMALAVGSAGCGGDEQQRPAAKPEDNFETAPDVTTCRADATDAPRPFSAAFPADWAFPPETTVFGVEDGGATGSIVTGVSTASFEEVLDFLSQDAVEAGFAITEREDGQGHAEANWNSTDYQGRWSIRESDACPGETVVQVLAVRVR